MALSKVDLANQVENQLPQNLVANNLPFRNIIINGDMSIAQRGTTASSLTSTSYPTVDRFQFQIGSAGTWSVEQSSTVPTGQGFAKSTKIDCTTADASLGASDYVIFGQNIEGQNLQYLLKGTASAKSLTCSFWVRSNKTGTYICEIVDNDNTRQISRSYTINSADTWEKKTLTFVGDTSGTLDNDNATSLQLFFWLAAGSTFSGGGSLKTSWGSTTNERAVGQVNLADSTANEWYITGVQLEAGTSASDFEFLPHDVNLQKCQRYCYVANSTNRTALCNAYFNTTTTVRGGIVTFPVTMRAAPTITEGGTDSNYNIARPNTSNAGASGVPATTQIKTNSYELTVTSDSASTIGFGTRILLLGDAEITMDSEL
jgi:hypothetical protein